MEVQEMAAAIEGVEALLGAPDARMRLRDALLVLRARNRRLAHALRDAKAAVADARAAADRQGVAVQGLAYRARHLQTCIGEARAHACVFRALLGDALPGERPTASLEDAEVQPLLAAEKARREAAAAAVAEAQRRAEDARMRLVTRRAELGRVAEAAARISAAAQPLFEAYPDAADSAAPSRLSLSTVYERLRAAAAGMEPPRGASVQPGDAAVTVAGERGRVVLSLSADGSTIDATLEGASSDLSDALSGDAAAWLARAADASVDADADAELQTRMCALLSYF